MKYQQLPYVTKSSSRIVFGCGNSVMEGGGDASYILDAVMDAGINTFDTAQVYRDSEISLGNWLKLRKNRDKLVIITKGCHPHGFDRVSPDCLKEDIENSFRRLNTDFIDVYLLHRDDLTKEPGIIIEALNEYLKAGKIGSFGCSNWRCERIDEANAYAAAHGLRGFTVSSPGFSLANTVENPWVGECISISGPENAAARRWYQERNMPVEAYSSLGRGFFSGRVKVGDADSAMTGLDNPARRGFYYEENLKRLERANKLAADKNCTASQIALAYLLCQPFPVYPVVASTSPEHIASNAASVDIQLTAEELAWLEA